MSTMSTMSTYKRPGMPTRISAHLIRDSLQSRQVNAMLARRDVPLEDG